MRNLTLHLPHLYLKLIDEIICDKDYPCTSEFIRVAIRKLLKRDMVLLSNPKIEKSSEEIQTILAKQKVSKLQKNLDQFRVILDMNPATKKELAKKVGLIPKKQTRIDTFWK